MVGALYIHRAPDLLHRDTDRFYTEPSIFTEGVSRPKHRRRPLMTDNMTDEIRQIVADNGKLAVDVTTLAEDDDLFDAGMTSHANVNVMLALEDVYDIEFPEELLRRSTFQSLSAIRDTIEMLLEESAA
jgi:acyl carrier protein